MLIKAENTPAIGRAYRHKGSSISLVPVLGELQPWHMHLVRQASHKINTVVIVMGGNAADYHSELVAAGADIVAEVPAATGWPTRFEFEAPSELGRFMPDPADVMACVAYALLLDAHDMYLPEEHYPLVLCVSQALRALYSQTRVHAVQPLRDAMGVSQMNLATQESHKVEYSVLEDFTTGVLVGPEKAKEEGHKGHFLTYNGFNLGLLDLGQGLILRDCFSDQAFDDGENANEDEE
ncbi:MAG: hypothetical protein Q3962_06460 [Corynebacterium sp.]|nr:hypothetical protein [Corynebacterium sp.]